MIALVADQFVFQIEKIIISKEDEVGKYQNYIEETKQNHIYFGNAFKNLTLELEFTTKKNNQESNKFIKNNPKYLEFIYEDFKIYGNYDSSFFNHLLKTNNQKISKITETYKNQIKENGINDLKK